MILTSILHWVLVLSTGDYHNYHWVDENHSYGTCGFGCCQADSIAGTSTWGIFLIEINYSFTYIYGGSLTDQIKIIITITERQQLTPLVLADHLSINLLGCIVMYLWWTKVVMTMVLRTDTKSKNRPEVSSSSPLGGDERTDKSEEV